MKCSAVFIKEPEESLNHLINIKKNIKIWKIGGYYYDTDCKITADRNFDSEYHHTLWVLSAWRAVEKTL